MFLNDQISLHHSIIEIISSRTLKARLRAKPSLSRMPLSAFYPLRVLINNKLGAIKIIKRTILCECGEFIQGHTFKDYIPTSIGPSTPTFGHSGCGLIFNLINGDFPKSYSNRVQLKRIAMRFAEMNKIEDEFVCLFLLEVDRIKSQGNTCDMGILISAYKKIQERIGQTAKEDIS
ncbi:MAG: hypothetical protein A4E49_01102 [Methanosaeta sp. PtaU1.Bin112]|nr:MAG: hypothetical protein A4E49_01102 [Methanosaeta sp. PtaU1.Bin112]